MTTAYNLQTGEKREYSCSPREAVIAAHAQEHNNHNTWEYEQEYGEMVEEGTYFYACGDWAARKEE